MIRSFCQMIDFPAEAIDCMENAYMILKSSKEGMDFFQTCKNALLENPMENLSDMLETLAQKSGLQRYTSDMLFWILCAQPLKDRYAEHHFPEEMYWDAMRDLQYKLMECYKFCGIWGTIAPTGWFAYFYTLKRLAFGRLQYDPWEWPYAPYKGKIQPGDTLYRIHIPAAGPLTKESVLDSFRKLHAYLKDQYPDGVVPIACRTWLLYPPLVKMFGENSNTAAFAGMFDLLDTQEDPNFSSFRWMFNLKYEGPETLQRVPTDTRFRRSAKAYFEAGNLPGTGCGVLLFDGEKILDRSGGGNMKQEYIIGACQGKSIDVKKGQFISVIDLDGGQVVDFFAENAQNPREFISPGVTIDCNESLKIQVGDLLYSNLYRPMFRVIADDVGEHDLLHPCCRPEMYDFFYHNGDGHPNCLDNINQALGCAHPIIHPMNLFMYTAIEPSGKIIVKPPLSKAGDRIILQAQMDVRLGVAACSVSESDCNSGKCTAVQILITDEIS